MTLQTLGKELFSVLKEWLLQLSVIYTLFLQNFF